MDNDSMRVVLNGVRDAVRETDAPLVLAVSGGLDSMTLLHAAFEVARDRVALVATFDHRTGAAAARAVGHVAREAAERRFSCVVGRGADNAPAGGGREAAWRRARHEFLRGVAAPLRARVVTAHTEDDQVETVLMRTLRGSGARGLAGLYAHSDLLRPLLGVRRQDVEQYARDRRVPWVNDPSNGSREYLRNRVRLDLLPALRRVRPEIDNELLALARRAAAWRAEADAAVQAATPTAKVESGELRVAAAELHGHDADSLFVMWGALAARLGLALDRRGTLRLAAFTMTKSQRGRMPLSGGWYMEARRGVYILGKRSQAADGSASLPAAGELRWGAFRFRVEDDRPRTTRERYDDGAWCAALSAGTPMVVRAWSAGDRLGRSGGLGARRVKRYLSEAGLRGLERVGWPVVEAGHGDVVWIPGVRRADAATERSGRPVRHYVCERISR